MNKQTLTKNQKEIRAFAYDWIITFSVLFLISIIALPPLIWNEENNKVFESRKRMLDLAYALKCYHTLTGEYTENKNLVIETIMHARDSLVADEYLSGEKDIYMSCSYDATFIQDSIKGSRKTKSLNLGTINKKDRLRYIDNHIYKMTKTDEGQYTREYIVPEIDDIKNIPDIISITQTDYLDTTIQIIKPSRFTIDSIFSVSNLIRFYRNDCEDTVRVNIPRNFSYMLDTLFSSSTIVSDNVIDTIYTLQEPINDNIDNLQTSYVKNQYLFRYIPESEYDSLWSFGISSSSNNLISLDSSYLNKWIIDTSYKITYIDPEEFTEVEEQVSNNFLRNRLNQTDTKSDKNIWKMIECNMNDCLGCEWDEIEGCVKKEEEEEEEDNIGSIDDVDDEEWAELFQEFEEELGNEMQFGDTLIIQYSFNSRKISNVEIINRVINFEDYDRKRYDLNAELLKCPITNKEYNIEAYGNGVYDIGEPFTDRYGKNGIYDSNEEFEDELTDYIITSPTTDDYKEKRFLIFKFHPGNPGFIKNDEVSWESKPLWNFPLK